MRPPTQAVAAMRQKWQLPGVDTADCLARKGEGLVGASNAGPVLVDHSGADCQGCRQGGGLLWSSVDAEEIYRNSYPDGRIVAEMAVGAARFRVADEAPEAANLSLQALKGTTVRLNLLVADPDAMARQAIEHGAIEVAPVADQSYGLRQGRVADPFGHYWLIGRPLGGDAGNWARDPGLARAT